MIGTVRVILLFQITFSEQSFPNEYLVCTKVPVFYCLMKKFKSQNFYQKFFSLILTNLDQTHRDLLKITTKKFGKNFVI